MVTKHPQCLWYKMVLDHIRLWRSLINDHQSNGTICKNILTVSKPRFVQALPRSLSTEFNEIHGNLEMILHFLCLPESLYPNQPPDNSVKEYVACTNDCMT